MSKLAEYRQLEKHLAEQLQALEALKNDGALKKKSNLKPSFVNYSPSTVSASSTSSTY